MRILILNWRDIKNPRSGGAEILTHEIAKRWVKLGHSVTLFCSKFKGSPNEEKIDGIRVIRRGSPDVRFIFNSVHFAAFLYYMKNFRGQIDVVVDEIHGLPFFTSLYVREKKVVLICEVAGELWVKMFGLFLGTAGRLIEKLYLRFLYRDTPYITISESTKKELISHGVKAENITVLPMGVSVPDDLTIVKKEKDPTLIYVGRLSSPKGIEDAIHAIKEIGKTIPKVNLWVVGRGDKKYSDYLKNLSNKLDITNKITFLGFVSEKKKFELISRAHVLLAPSVKEGWGLTVPEAAVVGTPSITYNSLGLRDVMKNCNYGLVTETNSPSGLSKKVIEILQNKKLYSNFIRQIFISKKIAGWDETAKVALKVLKNE